MGWIGCDVTLALAQQRLGHRVVVWHEDANLSAALLKDLPCALDGVIIVAFIHIMNLRLCLVISFQDESLCFDKLDKLL